jgi:hypothetical protein
MTSEASALGHAQVLHFTHAEFDYDDHWQLHGVCHTVLQASSAARQYVHCFLQPTALSHRARVLRAQQLLHTCPNFLPLLAMLL